MEPSQLNHLKEAAADIRRELNSLDHLYNLLDRSTDDHERIPQMHRHFQNLERALTRIEMCLKEIR